MKIVFIRVHRDASKSERATSVSVAKESSSSKSIIMALEREGLATRCEEWRLDGPIGTDAGTHSGLPVRSVMPVHFSSVEEPQVIWIEGSDAPQDLQMLFDAFPNALRVVYSKDWKPHKIAALERYHLCLVDEEHQVEEMRRRHPNVPTAVWDKLIDYDQVHRPLNCQKTYDICYVAYLRRRKNHVQLLRAIATMGRPMRLVFVGGDPDGRGDEIVRLAHDLRVDVDLVGEVSKRAVNEYINRSRIGVICAREDAAPRALLEYLGANVPALVNRELIAGARYVGKEAGLLWSLEDFAVGICRLLESVDTFSPRAHLLRHYSRELVVQKTWRLLEQAFRRAGMPVPIFV
jgi:glycosyltransferase involved in cell wall biosynthesis